jgi:hypothetical protein
VCRVHGVWTGRHARGHDGSGVRRHSCGRVLLAQAAPGATGLQSLLMEAGEGEGNDADPMKGSRGHS